MKRYEVLKVLIPGWLDYCIRDAAALQGMKVDQFVIRELTAVVKDILGSEHVREVVKEWKELAEIRQSLEELRG